MLILKIKEINDKSVTYKYFPNNDENIKPGIIQMDIDSLEVINAEKSSLEKKYKRQLFYSCHRQNIHKY